MLFELGAGVYLVLATKQFLKGDRWHLTEYSVYFAEEIEEVVLINLVSNPIFLSVPNNQVLKHDPIASVHVVDHVDDVLVHRLIQETKRRRSGIISWQNELEAEHPLDAGLRNLDRDLTSNLKHRLSAGVVDV